MNTNNIKGAFKKAEGSVESAYGEAAGDASAQLKGEADKTKGRILSMFGKVEDTVNNLANSAVDEAEYLRVQIKESPVRSALIALATGFLLGKLIG